MPQMSEYEELGCYEKDDWKASRKMQILKLKAQAANCERIAGRSEDEGLKRALTHRAGVLLGYAKQMEAEPTYELPAYEAEKLC